VALVADFGRLNVSDDYYRYSTDDDLASIVRLIEAYSHAANEGYPAFVEPEPGWWSSA
jgi:hypothetical protein